MNKRFFALMLGLSALLIVSACAAVSFGASGLSAREIRDALLDPEHHRAAYVILTAIRLPRLLAAIIGGVGLSLSGVILQNVMDNPLASPNTIGVNAGAGLAVVLTLALFPKASAALPVAAFFGAALTCLLIVLLSRAAGKGKTAAILSGIACTSLFQAFISLISALDTDVLTIYASFALGSFSGVGMRQLLLPLILITLCLILTSVFAGRISALSLGDTVAASLGVRVGALRVFCFLIASMSAASVVSYAGLLGFVGLVVPNMARKLVGGSLQKQIPTSALLAAILLIWTDLLGRTLFAPSEISVGIFTAMIGAPIFFAILLNRRALRYD